MQDHEPTPPESSWEDYPEPEPPTEPEPPVPAEIEEPTPPAESADAESEIQDDEQLAEAKRHDPLWEIASLLGVIDGTTQDHRTSLSDVLTAIEELTKPQTGKGGDPLQPTVEAILEMLVQLGQRQTAMEQRLTSMEEAQAATHKLVQHIRDAV